MPSGGGIFGGLAEGAVDVLEPIAKQRQQRRESDRERQAELLEHHMEGIGKNIAQAQGEMDMLPPEDPRRMNIQAQIDEYKNQHTKAAEAYHGLYGQQDLPGLLGRLQHWFQRKGGVQGTQPGQAQPTAPMAQPTAAGQPTAAPTAPAAQPAAGTAPTAQPTAPAAQPTPMSEQIPGTAGRTPTNVLNPGQLRKNPSLALTPEMSTAAAPRAASATWSPVGEQYTKEDGKVYQRERDTKSGTMRETLIPGPSPEDLMHQKIDRTLKEASQLPGIGNDENKMTQLKAILLGIPASLLKSSSQHPLEAKFNPSTGGLYSIIDKDTDAEYTESSISSAPPEVQRMWKDVETKATAERDRKDKEEGEKEKKRIEAEDRRFAKQLELQANALDNSLKKSSFDAAQKIVHEADDNYEDAIDRASTMDQNLKDATATGNQQAMLSLVANHIGMTLGAQKGARINQAIWNEAISSTPWLAKIGAKFDERGFLSGVTLTPQQMKDMVDLAHQRTDILKQHKERQEKKYSNDLGVKDQTRQAATPGALKDAAKPKGTAPKTPEQEAQEYLSKLKSKK